MGVSVHDRCNRWILYTALSQGLLKASFITLWDGEPGDGPGGTQNMVELVRKLTGRQPIIIDPANLRAPCSGSLAATADCRLQRSSPVSVIRIQSGGWRRNAPLRVIYFTLLS